MARCRYTPTYKFDVSAAGSRGDPSGPLSVEKISPAFSCGRERASLTVANHIAPNDIKQSVQAHSLEWVCPEPLGQLLLICLTGKTGGGT